MSKILIFGLDIDRHYRIWDISEVHLGDDSEGVYIPKLGDSVMDTTHPGIFILYRVSRIHPETHVATLDMLVQQSLFDDKTPTIVDSSGGFVYEGFNRLFVNTKVSFPHINPVASVIATHASLDFNGSENVSVKLFRGTDITAKGEVISVTFDSLGRVTGENIPLELVQTAVGESKAIKTMVPAFTMATLEDGELVTGVLYAATGVVTGIFHLAVVNTDFIRDANVAVKAIEDIRIISRYLSAANDRVLHYPQNLTLNTMDLRCRVTYSDGSKVDRLVDGVKVQILGLNNYVISTVGQSIPLVLKYNLDADESTYKATGVGKDKFITEPYEVITTDDDKSYNVKLFVVPRWEGDMRGYELEFWMYNLERDSVHHVTEYSIMGYQGSRPYYPTAFGVAQEIVVSTELSEVGLSYKPYRHVQTFTITLLDKPSNKLDPYRIDYNGDGRRLYGIDAYANFTEQADGKWKQDLTGGSITLYDWLEKLYVNSYPLVDGVTEKTLLQPTHFRVTIGDTSYVHAINDWSNITVVPVPPAKYGSFKVTFFRRTDTGDLELACAPLTAHHQELTVL